VMTTMAGLAKDYRACHDKEDEYSPVTWSNRHYWLPRWPFDVVLRSWKSRALTSFYSCLAQRSQPPSVVIGGVGLDGSNRCRVGRLHFGAIPAVGPTKYRASCKAAASGSIHSSCVGFACDTHLQRAKGPGTPLNVHTRRYFVWVVRSLENFKANPCCFYFRDAC